MEALPIRMYDNFRSKLKLADPDAKEMVESINEVIDRKIVNQNDTTMSMNRKDIGSLKKLY